MKYFSRKDAKAQRKPQRRVTISLCVLLCAFASLRETSFAQNGTNTYLFNDSHFHLTNYIQEGIDIHDFLKVMGNKAGRVALFGIFS